MISSPASASSRRMPLPPRPSPRAPRSTMKPRCSRTTDQALIRKLEEKTLQLQESNRSLPARTSPSAAAWRLLLKDSQHRLLLATDAARIGIWEWDIATGQMSWDARMYSLCGLSELAFDNTIEGWQELIHPEDRKRCAAELAAALSGEKDFHTEFKILWLDRQIRHLEAHGAIQRSPDGRPRQMIGVSWDITERKKLEAQFLRVQRMESIGTLAGGIAHDLNNVLAPILMAVEILGEHVTDEASKDVLATLRTSALHGADLVQQVLAFARGVEGRRVTVNPVHLLKDIGKIIRDTFPKNIDFHLSWCPDIWMLVGDPTQLNQVFTNLCVNARDAMPHGGALHISMENVTLEGGLSARPGQYVRIKVEDTGTGMPPAVCDKIFDPFFTTKEVGKGTGLGLSTVMAIVKGHGGFIDLDSTLGKGTIFTICLPANTSLTAAEQPAAEASRLPRGKGELILLVEDEENVRKIAQKTLERFGYRVVTAVNGAEAVALYARHRHDIAAVITDMAMPVMDGSALIVALKAMNPRVKIIGCSGMATKADITKATAAGVTHFIHKPYAAETIMNVLAEVLREE